MMFPSHQTLLNQAVAMTRRAHALLLIAPAGHGGGLFALSLAQWLLCEGKSSAGQSQDRLAGIACGQCSACRWFQQGSHPDFRAIRPASWQGVEQLLMAQSGVASSMESDDASASKAIGSPGDESQDVEEAGKKSSLSNRILKPQLDALADFLMIQGHRQQGRVVLLEPVEALLDISANFLLKVLEEPTPGLHFLLVAQSAKAILPTIRSRCQVLALPRIAQEEAVQWVAQQQAAITGGSIDLAAAQAQVIQAAGAPELALRLSDPELSTAHQLSLNAIASLPESDPIEVAHALLNIDAEIMVGTLQRWVEDLSRVAHGAPVRHFAGKAQRLKQLAHSVNRHALLQFAQDLAQQARVAHHPLNRRLYGDQLLLGYQGVYSSTA